MGTTRVDSNHINGSGGTKKSSGNNSTKKSYSKNIWDQDRESRSSSSRKTPGSGSSYREAIAKSWFGSGGGSDSGGYKINTMKDVMKNSSKWIGNKLNYKINAISQGSEGNCSALASIQALGTLKDAEKILRKTIKRVKDGFKVKLQGVKNAMFISDREVANDSTKRRNPKSDLETAILDCALHHVLGRAPYQIASCLQALTGRKVVAVNAATLPKGLKNGNEAGVGHWVNHAYALIKAAGNAILTKNPWNTSKNEAKYAGQAYRLWMTVSGKKSKKYNTKSDTRYA